MSIKVGIVSEGATEEGRTSLQDELNDIGEEHQGSLHVLVRRMVEDAGQSTPVFIAPVRTRKRGKGGLLKDLKKILVAYDEAGVNVVVVVTDRAEDNQTLKTMQGEIQRAQVGLRTVTGEAIEMFEAWLIADEAALKDVLGLKTIETGMDPEKRPGRDVDPESAKMHLQRLMGDAGLSGFSQVKKRIALRLNLEILASRCPRGFRNFKNDFIRTYEAAPTLEAGG